MTRGILAATVVVAAAVGFGSPAVGATDTTPPHVVDLEVSPQSFAEGGLHTDLLTVTAHITDDSSGVLTHGGPPTGGLCSTSPDAFIQRVSGTSTGGPLAANVGDNIPLTMSTGTSTDGVWQGTLPIPSTYDGTWQVVDLCVSDQAGNATDRDPRQQGLDATFTVDGTNQPLISKPTFRPDPLTRGSALTVSGTLIDATTRLGIPGQKVGVGEVDGCGPDSYNGSGAVTSSTGHWSYKIIPADVDVTPIGNACPTYTAPDGAQIEQYSFYDTSAVVVGISHGSFRLQSTFLSERPASASVPHNTSDAVNGAVWPADRSESLGRAILQRLVSGHWREASEAPIRASGRYTVVATPPHVGTNTYRVVRPSNYCTNGFCRYVGSVSPTFTITGT